MLKAILIILILNSLSIAQFNGHNTLGDYGVQAGTQPSPGLYTSAFYYNYDVDRIVNSNSNNISFAPNNTGDISINAVAGIIWYVSQQKILGANYGAFAALSFTNSAFEIPVLGINTASTLSFTDLYIQPVNLGWNTNLADYTAGIGLFIPTGNYELGGDNNTGLGMWSFEVYGGATFYFDDSKTWHFALTSWYETHTKKKDSELKVGDLLTLEGGLGKTFLEGLVTPGFAYYAQWKLTDDSLGDLPEFTNQQILIGKHRRYALGADITFPVPIKKRIIAILNARYFWEFGSVSTTQGNTLSITATFPIPSIAMQ